MRPRFCPLAAKLSVVVVASLVLLQFPVELSLLVSGSGEVDGPGAREGTRYWRSHKCAADLFWRGSPIAVFHYKKSTDEMAEHYRAAWGIVRGKNETAKAYNGNDPITHPQGKVANNDCPNFVATAFGRFQRVARRVPWKRRRGAGNAGPVCLPEGRVAGARCRRHFAAVEVVMKGERLEYVREFIEHHIAVGFSHVYIAVDGDEASAQQYARPLQEYTVAGVLTVWSCPYNQGPCHRIACERYCNSTFWMARVDIDEFIVPYPPPRSVVPLLLPLTGRHGEVPLQLMLGRFDFGHNGWQRRPPEGVPLAEAYTASEGIGSSVKSIFQTDGASLPESISRFDMNPHTALGDGAGICQDLHWLPFGALACWPQHPRLWWPPRLPRGTCVPQHAPAAGTVWQALDAEQSLSARALPKRLQQPIEGAATAAAVVPAAGPC